ncbi:MAG TPA: TolC family protein [Isosphaeraceae bacterium]|nr:TolC family protein [Isosphaeraceae bacterium]
MADRKTIGIGLGLAAAMLLVTRPAGAQGPTIPSEPRGGIPARGPGDLSSPGTSTGLGGSIPGGDEILGGRPGPSVPRVPRSLTRPGTGRPAVPRRPGIAAPPSVPIGTVPIYGALELPRSGADEGPPDGLTFDAAIERLVHENLALRSRFFEIPQARADVLTAGLRANPLLYADAQLIPYGEYSAARPGGQTQYDLNVTYPIDISRKRQARTRVAARGLAVLEAQYQDAVRLQIDNLATAYVDALVARETVRFARAGRAGLAEILDRTTRLYRRGDRTIADVSRIKAQFEAAEVGAMDAEESLRRANRTLGALLEIPPDRAEGIELRGTIHDVAPGPPPIGELTALALATRPDLAAYRLGVRRAEDNVRLQKANRFSDVYLLYQPYTFQNNAPLGLKSATSWALGMTVPLPVYDRNQGNIERARLNVSQTKVELTDRERQAVVEVRQAEREYAVTRAAVARIETELLPAAERVYRDTKGLYLAGEEGAIVFLNAQREYNDVLRQYRDTLARHRRAMLRLNTAVARRVLP